MPRQRDKTEDEIMAEDVRRFADICAGSSAPTAKAGFSSGPFARYPTR
jgi:hypothetical protein